MNGVLWQKKRPPFLVVSTNPPKKKNTHNPSKHQVSLKLIGNLRRISKILLKVQVSNRHSECESIWDILSFKSSLINSWLTPPTKKKNEKISKFHHVGPKVGSFFRNRFWLFSHLLLQKGMLSVTMIYFFFLQPSFFPCYAAPKNSYLLEMLAQKNKKNLPNDGLMVIDHE